MLGLYVTGMHREPTVLMRRFVIAAAVLAMLACRGEKTPRDYENEPPAMTHPPTNAKQTPAANGMQGAPPEPSKGVEGKTTQPVNPVPAPPPKLKDQAPATRT